MEFRKLGEFCTVKGGKRLPKGTQLQESKTNHPYLRIKDFNNGNIDINNLMYISEEVFNKISNYTINKGNIFLSIVGTIGLVDIIEEELDKSSLTENAVKIYSNDEKQLSTEFLSYYLKSTMGQHEISIRTVGSTQPKLAITRIKDINVPMIDIKKQYKITWILSNIDKKIKLNRTIIANLEELSQTLFKRWFVDFEFPDEDGNPYKSSGGEMIDSELGEIPKGWKVSKFNDYIENIIAGDWGKQNEEGNYTCPTRIIRGADLDSFSKGNKGKAPIRYILEKNYKKKKLIAGDIIIEISGGSPTQSTGRTLLIDNNIITYNDKLVSTNFCKVIRPSVNYYSDWINEYLKYLYDRNVFFNYENGTTGIKNLDYKSVLNTMKIISPEIYLIKKFHYQTHKYYNYIQTLGYENKKLQDLRDTLLPKLMSGEIEIPDDVEVNNDELSI